MTRLPRVELTEADFTALRTLAPLIDWRAEPPVVNEYELTTDSAGGIATAIRRELVANGAAVVRLSGLPESDVATQASVVTGLVSLLAEPIKVFRSSALWRELAVDMSRPADRSGGAGAQQLHLDFVNASRPPDFIFLYCIRSDPKGGGASLLAHTSGISGELPVRAVAELGRRVFRDGEVRDLVNIGRDINPFAVLEDGTPLRYTGKLLDSTDDHAGLLALELLRDRLNCRIIEVMLEAGDLLVIDQRLAVHGRAPLGDDQEAIPSTHRRLLMHGFGRARSGSPWESM